MKKKPYVIHPIELMNLKCAVRSAECIVSRCMDSEVQKAAKEAFLKLQALQRMIEQKQSVHFGQSAMIPEEKGE